MFYNTGHRRIPSEHGFPKTNTFCLRVDDLWPLSGPPHPLKKQNDPKLEQESHLGLPDFSWYNIPKRGKCTKLPENTYK
jgi:hypothetical protein